jgi:hypothetical protein
MPVLGQQQLPGMGGSEHKKCTCCFLGIVLQNACTISLGMNAQLPKPMGRIGNHQGVRPCRRLHACRDIRSIAEYVGVLAGARAHDHRTCWLEAHDNDAERAARAALAILRLWRSTSALWKVLLAREANREALSHCGEKHLSVVRSGTTRLQLQLFTIERRQSGGAFFDLEAKMPSSAEAVYPLCGRLYAIMHSRTIRLKSASLGEGIAQNRTQCEQSFIFDITRLMSSCVRSNRMAAPPFVGKVGMYNARFQTLPSEEPSDSFGKIYRVRFVCRQTCQWSPYKLSSFAYS